MNRNPIIGIVTRPGMIDEKNVLTIMESYRHAIIESGGNTIAILPPQLVEYHDFSPKQIKPLSDCEKLLLEQQIDLCDGVLMPGGVSRYDYDRYITDYCLKKDIPVLGICLGMQLLATHINRDTLEYTDEFFSHSKIDVDEVHKVELDKSSKLFAIIGKDSFFVNSRHKFKVTDLGEFSAVGYSSDGVIEAIEHKNKRFAIGVQWHPENLMHTEASQKLFSSFIKECQK